MSVVFTLKDILGQIFISGGNEGRKNGALNVMGSTIFSSFKNIG